MSYVGYLLIQLLEIYTFIIIAAVIISWLIAFNVMSPSHPVTQKIMVLLAKLTDPVMRPVQRVIPSIGGIDLSPIIVIFAIMLLQRIIFQLLVAPGMAI